MARRFIVGISGASGVVLGIEVLRALGQHECDIHLVVSKGAKETLRYESDDDLASITALADHVHPERHLAAAISSGSFVTDGMIVAPCSMKTLAGIAHGYAENLIVRAADVCLKEGRKVVLVPREMPLGRVHLRNLLAASEIGCAIVPPMLSFYNRPTTLAEQVDHVVGKVLMQFGLEHDRFRAWAEPHQESG